MMPFLFRMSSFLLFFCSVIIFLSNEAHGTTISTTLKNTTFEDTSLKVAVADFIIPYQFVDKNKPAGYVIDVWKAWGKANNVNIEFVVSDWETSLTNVSNGVADVHGALVSNSARNESFSFAGAIYNSPIKLYFHKDIKNVKTLADAKPFLVGHTVETDILRYIDTAKYNLRTRVYDDWQTMRDGILADEVRAFVSFDYFAYRYDGYQTIQDLFPNYNSLTLGQVVSQIAVKKGQEELLENIVLKFSNIEESVRKDIDNKWFGRTKGDDTLLLGLTVGAEPFMGVNNDGEATGLFVDLWREWANVTGTKIRFMPNSMELALQAVRVGETDIHIGFPESLAVNSGLPRGRHLYSTYSSLFVYDSYDFNQGVTQLNGETIGMYLAAPYQKRFMTKYPDINVRYFVELDDAINASIKGEIKGFVTSTLMTKIRLEQNNIEHRFQHVVDVNYEARAYALVTPKKTSLIKDINDGFDLFEKETFLEIENKWIDEPSSRYYNTLKDDFKLSLRELNWVADNPKMSVGIVADWKPYEFVDSNGDISGISKDMFDIATKLTGQQYDFVVYATWDQLYNDFVSGNIDIVANISASDHRRAFANFTSAYWRTPWSVITHKSEGNVSSIKKFYGKRLAIIQGYQIIKEVHDKHPQVIIQVVKDFDEAHRLLKAGIVEGVLDLMSISAQYVQDNSLYQYKIHVLDDMGSDNAHIGVRKELAIQARIMEKMVLSLSETDIEDILTKWHTVDVVSGIKTEVYFRNITLIIVIGGILFSIVLFWNRKLKHEIQLRKQAEEKLTHLASHDVLTGLPNRALLSDRLKHAIDIHSRNSKQLALLFLDLDGFKQINDTYGHDVGDELLIQVAQRLSKISRASDTVARFGGDEFVLLVTNLAETEVAAKISQKIITDLCQPFELTSVTVTIGCSIGIGCFPISGSNINRLIKSADDAMYKVKASGKNNYAFA